MAYHFLEDGEISIHDDRWLTYPWGVNGALPGQRRTKEMTRADGSTEFLPSKCDRVAVQSGDILYFNTWGGGGVGEPLTREPTRVLEDVLAGLVSIESANKNYGVVITNDIVDEVQTAKLRKDQMDVKPIRETLFNFGGSVEEIRSRCLEETGIEPPKAPDFSKARRAAR